MKKLLLSSLFLLTTVVTNIFGTEIKAQIESTKPTPKSDLNVNNSSLSQLKSSLNKIRIFLKMSSFITDFVAKRNNLTIILPKEFESIAIKISLTTLLLQTPEIQQFILERILEEHSYVMEETTDKVFKIVKQKECPQKPIEKLWSW